MRPTPYARPRWMDAVDALPLTAGIRVTFWMLVVGTALAYLGRVLFSPITAAAAEWGGFGTWLTFVAAGAGIGELSNVGKRLSYDVRKDPKALPAIAETAANVAAPVAAAVAAETVASGGAASAVPAPPDEPEFVDPNGDTPGIL